MEEIAPDHIARQVQALLERRRTTQARSLLKPALASHPDHMGLLLQAAWTDYLDDREDEALLTVRQVLLSEPANESARLLYFELLLEKGSNTEAEQAIIELLREFPEHAHYYGRYSRLMLNTLNVVKARQLAHEGLKYDPDNAECLAGRTICDFIERPDGEASHGLQQLLVRHPQSIQTLLLVVVALQQRGDLKNARRISRELVLAQPDNAHLVNLAREMKISTHWSMLPLWPLQRYGWGASVAMWLLAVFGLRAIGRTNPALGGVLSVIVLIYVVYSWTWPAILRRLIRA